MRHIEHQCPQHHHNDPYDARYMGRVRSQDSLRNPEIAEYIIPDRRYYRPLFGERDHIDIRRDYRNIRDRIPQEPRYERYPIYPRYEPRYRDPISRVNEEIKKQNEERKEPVREEVKQIVKQNQEKPKVSSKEDLIKEDCTLIANILKDYADLQSNEDAALNSLFIQKNYSIFKALELLNPHLGLIDSKALLSALKNNLGINIEDDTIADDLIGR